MKTTLKLFQLDKKRGGKRGVKEITMKTQNHCSTRRAESETEAARTTTGGALCEDNREVKVASEREATACSMCVCAVCVCAFTVCVCVPYCLSADEGEYPFRLFLSRLRLEFFVLLLLLRLPRVVAVVVVIVVGPLAVFATLFSHLFLARGLVVGSAQTPAADATRCLGARTHTKSSERVSELTQRTRPQSQFISARELLCATRRIGKK